MGMHNLRSVFLAALSFTSFLENTVASDGSNVACNLVCDSPESGAKCECVCGGDYMTITFPLSYCGIKPLPEKFGFNGQQVVSVEVPEELLIPEPSQTIFTNDDLPSSTSNDQPFFGNTNGNFQPFRDASALDPFQTGGKVNNPKIAVTSINNKDGIGAGRDQYTLYLGDGSRFPRKSQWASFEDMFNNNKKVMFGSCQQFKVPNDDGPEVGAIYDGIQAIAQETKVDHRFILAVIMQESGGCVRAPTSNFGVRNPGLMQDHNGVGTCNSDITHKVQYPCPTGIIFEMIREGTAGTKDGDGLAQCINQSGSSDATAFYKAARIYNSGSIDKSGKLEAGIATHCYASDIANRLTGWVSAPHNCRLDG